MDKCFEPCRGIPYSFNGCLSMEQKVNILAKNFCSMKEDINNEMNDWFKEWVINNLDGVFGDIMYNEEEEKVTFSITPLINNAVHTYKDGALVIEERR